VLSVPTQSHGPACMCPQVADHALLSSLSFLSSLPAGAVTPRLASSPVGWQRCAAFLAGGSRSSHSGTSSRRHLPACHPCWQPFAPTHAAPTLAIRSQPTAPAAMLTAAASTTAALQSDQPSSATPAPQHTSQQPASCPHQRRRRQQWQQQAAWSTSNGIGVRVTCHVPQGASYVGACSIKRFCTATTRATSAAAPVATLSLGLLSRQHGAH